MLVLTRKKGEKIVVRTPHGEVIVITLGEHQHGRTKVGIDAPRDVTVHRWEVDVAIHGPPATEPAGGQARPGESNANAK